MDIKKLIRDPDRIKEALTELPDGRLVTKKPIKIITPCRFEERGLLFIGIETIIIGIYAIVLDDLYYGISLSTVMIKIEPMSTIKIEIDGVMYYEFSFDAGSTVMSSITLVKNDELVYKVYDEIISKARVPWFISYSDLGKIFDTVKYFTGANIGNNREVTELIVSLISRDSKDRHKFYRQTIESLKDIKFNPPEYVSLKSVAYSATNTTNKLAGSYYSSGVISALVDQTVRVEKIEKILKR